MKKKGLALTLISAVIVAVLFLSTALRPSAIGSADDTKPVKAIFEGAKIITYREVNVDPEDPISSSGDSNETSEGTSQSSSSADTSSSQSSTSSADTSSSQSSTSSSSASVSSASESSSEPEKEPETELIEEIVDAPDNTAYYDNLTEAIEDIEAAGASSAVVIIEGKVTTVEPYSTVNISSGNISLFLNGGHVGADIRVSEDALLEVTDDDSFPTITLTNGTFSITTKNNYFEIGSGISAGVSVPTASRDFGLVTEDIYYSDDPGTPENEETVLRKTFVFRDFTAPVKSGSAYYYRYESSLVTSEKLMINKALPDGISGIRVEVSRVPEEAGFSIREVAANESRISLAASPEIASAASGVDSAGIARDYYFGEPLIHLAVDDSESENYQLKDGDGNIMEAKAFCPDYLYALSGSFTLTDVVWNPSSGHMTTVFSGSDDISVSYTKGSTTTQRTWVIEGKTESENKDVFWLYDEDGVGNFYTIDEEVRDSFIKDGFEDRGTAWKAPIKSNKPVYMVFNANEPNEYFYTTDKNEYINLLSVGWKGKGIVFYASTETNMYPIYRQYNKQTGRHNFTSSTHEKNVLVSEYGWNDEGIAWFAQELPFLK